MNSVLTASRHVDRDAVRIYELELAVLASCEQLESDIALGSAGLWRGQGFFLTKSPRVLNDETLDHFDSHPFRINRII